MSVRTPLRLAVIVGFVVAPLFLGGCSEEKPAAPPSPPPAAGEKPAGPPTAFSPPAKAKTK